MGNTAFYQIFMDENKQWLWSQKEPILPTRMKSRSSFPSISDGVAYFRLWFKSAKNSRKDNFETNSNSTNVSSSHFPKGSASTSSFVPVSFPSYLNSSGSKQNHRGQQVRRSSLLEGFEETLHLMSTSEKQTRLTLPKDARQKSGHAKAHLRLNSHLPVPLVPLPKFKVPSTLYGYLDEGSFKKGAENPSTKFSVIAITLLFLAAVSLIIVLYQSFPEMERDEWETLKLPRNMEDAKILGRILSKYKNTYYFEVLAAFFVTYIFLQTFAIPGSVFLSILSGFLYPFYLALFLVCLCSGIGATGCYMISYLVGKPLINKYLAERVERWNTVVDGQREHLFNYLLFLRITPFLPNWFINVVSPVIRIPVSLFFIATFFGVAPLSFIAIEGGTTLYQLTTAGDAISWTNIIIMGLLALLSIVPVVVKTTLKKKFE